MSVLALNDILNFWKCFLHENINLWDYNKMVRFFNFFIQFFNIVKMARTTF